ncbi:MAG: hypothetical protein QOJ34_943 [Pseudonocardiales bacterium]|nr:hypothetical protein [Pseudonocardiales bacterium]
MNATHDDRDDAVLRKFGYQPQLKRTLGLFSNFGIAFCYLSPVVGIYSLFVLGLGAGGPAYIWLMPLVVAGQLLVALTFAELASGYPLAGALFQWAKRLVGPGYAWWVGWIYGWALILTIAAVDTGVAPYAGQLLNDVFGTHIDATKPNTILLITLGMLLIQTTFNVTGVKFSALISRAGVVAEVGATFGIALLLLFAGFHHGLDFLFTTQHVQDVKSNPLGVDFKGHWLVGAGLIAILAHVYIFYGFESAGDVAEEVKDPQRKVPRAMIMSLVIGFITSFILVAAFILAIPKGGFSKAASFEGGINYIIGSNISSLFVQDVILAFVVFAFFSCGTAIQAAAARLVFSYSRDDALPASKSLRHISLRFKTPVTALIVAGAILPALFALLVHFNPSHAFHIGPFLYPAKVNALLILISFGVSGIYLAFQMVMIAALIARLRGWKPDGPFQLGRWGLAVNVAGIVYGVLMLINIVLPTGLDSPRGALFNYGNMTLGVILLLIVVGGVYYVIGRPDRKIAGRHPDTEPEPPVAAGPAAPGIAPAA